MSNGRKFFVFEGIDSCGKTSIINRLKEDFKEEEFFDRLVYYHEPSHDNPIGRAINELLTSEEVVDERVFPMLFGAERTLHTYQMLGDIKNDKIIIADRFVLSSLAFNACAVGYDRVKQYNEIPLDMLNFNMKATCGVTIFIDISPETSMERSELISKRDQHESNIDLLNETYQRYHDCINLYKEEQQIVVIDGERNFEDVYQEVKKIVRAGIYGSLSVSNTHYGIVCNA